MKNKLITASLVLILAVPFVFGGCNPSAETAPSATTALQEEGFAVYRTRDNIPVDKMEMQSHVAIADEPVISEDDIVSYRWDTHGIQLTEEAFQRIDQMEVPMSGISFVVCVNKAPLYWGAFWTPLSSQSFDGVTILVPSLPLTDNVIRLELGYPTQGFFRGDDPRNNPDVREALQKAGKLVYSGFAIYLTKENISPEKLDTASHIDIADEPLITQNDIIAYEWDTHTIKLTAEAYARVAEMEVPLTGISFAVCVDKDVQYCGAFWSGLSSYYYPGITILLIPVESDRTLTIRNQYPADSPMAQDDPRSNPDIMEALEAAGKLR